VAPRPATSVAPRPLYNRHLSELAYQELESRLQHQGDPDSRSDVHLPAVFIPPTFVFRSCNTTLWCSKQGMVARIKLNMR
jgi:hypothetical protein